jgi:molecular chaperone DnaK
MGADNKLLGNFDLTGIRPAPRGVPQIEVTLDIDANGIVSVSAKDKGTGKEQQIRIQPSGGLSKEDIDKVVREAEQFAGEDKKRREAAEARNQADGLIQATERQLAEHGDKVDAATKSAIESAIADLKAVLDGGDAAAITAKTQALAESAMKLGEAIYKAPQESSASADAAADAKADGDNVVDADFEEVDETKRDDKGQSA